MNPATVLGIGIGIGVVIGIGPGCGDPIVQPFQFNHKKHADEDVDCSDCHKFYETQTFSGLPTIADCMECHEDPLTEGAQEKELHRIAEKGHQLVWKRLYRVPDHVYYSHRRHVVLGKIKCEQCHGTMGQSKRPPKQPPTQITMAFCIDCHERQQVNTDCVACHR